MIVAVDPGPVESAFVIYGTSQGGLRAPLHWAKAANEIVRSEIAERARLVEYQLAVEMVASYGMPVGAEVFETVLWTGIFCEAWMSARGTRDLPRRVYRREVKLHLCASARANDANVRQALIDRFGGSKERAVGRKATPGPLYGLTRDSWAALGVAITADETKAPA